MTRLMLPFIFMFLVGNAFAQDKNLFIHVLAGNKDAPKIVACAFPEFAFLMNGMTGNFKLGIISGGQSTWLNHPGNIKTNKTKDGIDFEITNQWLAKGKFVIRARVLSNIRILYRGGHSAEDGKLAPPENEKLYPEPWMFGTIPASAFFVRHAANIRFHNVQVGFMEADDRPAFVLDDARNIRLTGVEVQKTEKVQLVETRNGSSYQIIEN